jgi:hypothetical protein
MVQIGNAIVSLDVFEKHFVCNLPQCKGMCCVYGTSGAPLEDAEIPILERIYHKVKPYMTPEGIDVIEKTGVFETDWDDDKVTPLVGTEDCAYTCYVNGIIIGCAIEQAYHKGEIDFQKPVSCHLYPIRITRFRDFEAVNYHHWNICRDALKLGKKNGTPLYVFLKEPLTRKYGATWYEQLCVAAEYLKKQV